MEAPRFIKNKTAGFSSAVLALSLIACSDKAATKFTPTPSEQNHITAEVIVGPLADQNIDESTLDHSCGKSLGEGDGTLFRIPTKTEPLDIDFKLVVEKNETGNLSLGGLPVSAPMYIGAISPGKTDGIPLGFLLPIPSQQRIFFAPFLESRQYLVDGCPQIQ